MIPLTGITDELTRFVQCEAEATRSAFAQQWSRPLTDRIAEGRCIDQLAYASTTHNRFIVLRCENGNHSDFREGDLVRLSRGDPTDPVLSENLYRVEDDRIWIEPQQWSSETLSEVQMGSWVIDRSFLDLESFYRKAVDDLGQLQPQSRSQLSLFLPGGCRQARAEEPGQLAQCCHSPRESGGLPLRC